MAEKVEKRIEMGVGYYYDMAGRWAGLGPLHRGKVCKKLVGVKKLTGKFRLRKIRLVAEVLKEEADQVSIPHQCTATCEVPCGVCGRKYNHIMLDAAAPDPDLPGVGDLGVMMRWNYIYHGGDLMACKGDHHRSAECDWFKLDEKQARWYRTYIEHGVKS